MGAFKLTPRISDRAWVWSYAVFTAAIIGIDLIFASSKWVGYLAGAVMALVTAGYCVDQYGKSKPELRLSWAIMAVFLALTSLGYFFSAFIVVHGAYIPTRAGSMVNLAILNGYGTYTVAKNIPLVFLFSQIEDGDDSLFFRAIDIVQSILIVSLVILVFTPTLMGADQNTITEERWLRAAAYLMVLGFGVVNWLGRKPGEDRQLVGAVNCYFIVKAAYNLWLLTTPEQTAGRPAAGLANLLTSNDVLADFAFLLAVVHGRHHSKPNQPSRSTASETMRVLNPVIFTAALLALSFALGLTLPRWGSAVAAVAMLLYVMRSVRWQSDFRRLQRESIAVAQNKARMLTDIGHEIRAPLASVTLNASQLHRQGGLSADQAVKAKPFTMGENLSSPS